MKIRTTKFILSATGVDACPDWANREFALIGRSNVGKSSLINMLTGKSGLAKVSATPGKTRQLNFFLINEKWSLVDLPGYGYAKVAKSEKIDFNETVGDYIEQRENLTHVFVLIDSRLEPQRIDLEFLAWLNGCSTPYSLIFTKTDKQSPTRTRENIATFMASLPEHQRGEIQTFSSSAKDRAGQTEILHFINSLLG